MINRRSERFPQLLITMIVAFAVISCSSSKKGSDDDRPEKELTTKNKINHFLEEKEDSELIKKGKWYVERALPSTAEEAFDALLTSFPDSIYTEFAQLKTADGYFSTGAYLSAAKAYADFVAQHPNDRNVPYASLRQGRSYFKSYRGIGRDLAPLEQAQSALATFINKYPNSLYTTEARALLKEVNEKMLAHHESIASFYEKRGLLNAAKQHRENTPRPPTIYTAPGTPILNPEYSNP